MGRRASPWPVILTGPEQILGARWPSLFRAAPRPVQQALLAVGRHAPGRSGSLPAERFDCVILTQVLQFLAPEQALRNVWASIAPGGTLLITVPTLGRLDPHHQETHFWRWTPGGLAGLLGRVGIPARVAGHGNVLACVATLWGPSVQDLSAEELDVNDSCFPLVACAHADKPA